MRGACGGRPPTPSCTARSSATRPSDRKSTRLNSSHTVIYTLSLHDALPIFFGLCGSPSSSVNAWCLRWTATHSFVHCPVVSHKAIRSEEHTSELQSHSDLHSFPTRRSSDLLRAVRIAFFVGECVVLAVDGHPLLRALPGRQPQGH